MQYLTKEEILFLNKNNISRFGGNFVPPYNLLHESALDYLIEIVDSSLFGEPMYPHIPHKAEGIFVQYYLKSYFYGWEQTHWT